MSPAGALRELLADLAAHQAAAQSAARAAVAGTVHEFDPSLLKQRLLGAGRGLFESARAWEAYVRHYEDRQRDLPGWIQQLLDRHHAPAYALEHRQARQDAGRSR